MTIGDLDKLNGIDFERSLEGVLKANGFGEISFTPKTADFGADILTTKDNCKCAVQIKRSTSPVSISAVQEVLGALAYYQCSQAWVITNSIFTPAAVELAQRAKVSLVARDQLKGWLSKLKLSDTSNSISPLPHQVEALAELARQRADRQTKSLVIMAAGLGKTFTAAFDVAQFERNLIRPARVLFLAHQSIILEQAARAFKRLFGESRSFGRFDGEVHDKKKDFLFATFQSVSQNLNSFDKDEFDYVVVDEAHHTAAETRDKVVSHFVPLFLLGLTATPNRFDGKDITGYFDDNIAINLPLEKALARNLLTPIDYRVYTDKGGSEEIDAEFLPRSDKEIVSIITKTSQKVFEQEKTIIFCNSIEQMDHFSGLFPNCKTISGRESRDRQVELVDQFIRGDYGILLARDVLNEGIDIPDANMVVFLRNSESPVVFLQQLGRGLRKAIGKSRVVALDFVSNIDRIRYVYSFCSRLKNFERNERKNLSDDSDKPFASSVEFDEQARNIVKTLLEKKVSSGLLVGLSGLVTAFDHQINSKTIRKFCSIARLEPDYELPNKNGGFEFYFESETVKRFLRQVFKKPNDSKLFDENYFCKLVKKKPSDFRKLEKWGRLAPSWIHKMPNGKFIFYYTEADLLEFKSLK